MLIDSEQTSARRLRILQVAPGMRSDGVSRWLMQVWRGVDKSRYQFDFITTEGAPGAYDEEIKTLGGRLVPLPPPSKRRKFLKALRKALRENGPYDIVHSHAFSLSGPILYVAASENVAVRLTHAHTDRRKAQRDKSKKGRAYGWLSRQLIRIFSTAGLASSMQAAGDMFGDRWWFDPKWQIMPCGIDLRPYNDPQTKNLRAALGIPAQAKVVGHAGDFSIEKNHEFLLRVFSDYARGEPKALLLLMGEGPLRGNIEEMVRALGLEQRVVYAPEDSDIPSLMRSMDVFVYPALHDGLGMMLIEAQAAGLPCLIAEAMPQDIDAVKGSVMRLSDEASPDIWAEKIKLLIDAPRPHVGLALETLKDTEFNIAENVRRLTRLYEQLYTERMDV